MNPVNPWNFRSLATTRDDEDDEELRRIIESIQPSGDAGALSREDYEKMMLNKLVGGEYDAAPTLPDEGEVSPWSFIPPEKASFDPEGKPYIIEVEQHRLPSGKTGTSIRQRYI